MILLYHKFYIGWSNTNKFLNFGPLAESFKILIIPLVINWKLDFIQHFKL